MSIAAAVVSASRLFEEVIERLPCAGRTARRRSGLTFDGGARFERCAVVPRIFRGDTRRDRSPALEESTRVEVETLCTGMQRRPAPSAPRLRTPRRGDRELVPAWRTPDHLTKPRHVERLRGDRRLPARGVFLFRLRAALRALPRFVLIATLPVLAFAHAGSPNHAGMSAGLVRAIRARRASAAGRAAASVVRTVESQRAGTCRRSRS